MSQRFVITGTGRSGTQWASEVLSTCHVNCGHQAVFRHEHTLGRRVHWGSYHGDSSFEAVPMLAELHPAVIVVTIARHPLDVMRSWRSKGLFTDKIETWEKWALLSRVLEQHFPDVMAHPEPMGRAALYWTQWLQAAINGSHKVLNLEGLHSRDLFAAVDRPNMYKPELLAGLPERINATPENAPNRGPDCLGDIPEDVRAPLVRLACRLGYEVR